MNTKRQSPDNTATKKVKGKLCFKTKTKNKHQPTVPLYIEEKGWHMLFAINEGWAYELVPCNDAAILAVDEELQLL